MAANFGKKFPNPNFSNPNPNLISPPHLNYNSSRPPDKGKKLYDEEGFEVVESKKSKLFRSFQQGETSHAQRSEHGRYRGGAVYGGRRVSFADPLKVTGGIHILKEKAPSANLSSKPLNAGSACPLNPNLSGPAAKSMDPVPEFIADQIQPLADPSKTFNVGRHNIITNATNGVNLRFNAARQGTWREVATGGNTDKRRALNFFDPYNIDDMKVALIGEDTFKKGGDPWKNSVVLYVVGPRPKYFHFKAYATRTWKPKGGYYALRVLSF